MANTALKVADLDFFSIRENLKTYLKSQDVFTDYDFEGSGLTVLLDILSYNTYYNGFYLNMVANESFLDTAQIRQNILSLSKAINYIPHSRKSAEAKVNIKIIPGANEDQSVNYIVLDRYTKFLGADKNGNRHTFVAINSNTSTKQAGVFNFANVVIKQGEVATHQFSVTANNVTRKYEIPSQNVDTSTLSVNVIESSSNNYTENYTLAQDITLITGDSKVFFLEENNNLNYSIYFGDDIIGKRPKDGNIVSVTYLDSVGSMANNITRFVVSDPISGFSSNVSVTTMESSRGGKDKETIEQIRFRAPHHYTAQNRAVTKQDYESLIVRDFDNIDAVSVWGGEENDPPVYGKVFMSIKTKNYYSLTNYEKEIIKETLISTKNVLTVIPEIVDPTYCFLLVKGKVTYDPTLTSKSASELNKLVREAIISYNNDELNTFKATFKKSRLQYYIDNCDPSITGSDLVIFMQRQIPLVFEKTQRHVVTFNSSLQKGTISDKLYSFPEMIVSDGLVQRSVLIEEVPSSYTGVDSVEIVNPGRGYLTPPTVTITGDGSNAKAEATIVNGKIESIKVTNRGSNYTRAFATITSTSGIEGVATVKLEARYGDLRAYYYNTLGEKVIVVDNIGTVDYDKGIVTLDNIYPMSLVNNPYYDTDIITINVLPAGDIIPPLRERILSIDPNNAESILIEMVPE